MPLVYLRRLTAEHRTPEANWQLGLSLAFVAGAANAGGFLAVHQYTSHMTGIISALADDLALSQLKLVFAGLAALLTFLAGTMCSTIMINWARHRRLHSLYALPLLVEAMLMLCFGILGSNLDAQTGLYVPLAVMLLCFIMGLQNAIVTKISKAEIRTTHLTGVVTDIGIELGKLFYWNRTWRKGDPLYVSANRSKLRMLSMLLLMFFVGGFIGALGFKHIGFSFSIPLALILMVLAVVPVMDDLWHRCRALFQVK